MLLKPLRVQPLFIRTGGLASLVQLVAKAKKAGSSFRRVKEDRS
jgi:hypothetical protein